MKLRHSITLGIALALSLGAVAAPRAVAQHITPNHASAKLGVAHAVGDGQLQLASGGTLFGAPTPANPLRVVAVTVAGQTETLLAILDATGISGNTLTGVTNAAESYNGQVLVDVNLPIGTVIECRLTDGLMAEVRAGAGSGNLRAGTARYDVTQYGATAGSTTAKLDVAFAAIKAAAAAAGVTSYVIDLPSNTAATPWYFSYTLQVPSGCHVYGAGRDNTWVKNTNHVSCSAFAFGIYDKLSTTPLSNHWQSLAGIAGSTWSGRVGFRTCTAGGSSANSDYSEIQLQPNAMAYGPNYDGWAATQGFTIELLAQGYTIVDPGTGKVSQPGPIPPGATFGMWDAFGAPSPYAVTFEGSGGLVASNTANTVTCPDTSMTTIGNNKSGFTAGWLTFCSGALAGQSYQVTAGAHSGGNYTFTVSPNLAANPAANDTVSYASGVTLKVRAATTLLNGQAGVYDGTYGGPTYYYSFKYPAVSAASAASAQRWVFQVDTAGATTAANQCQAAVSFGSEAQSAEAWLAMAATNAPTSWANPYFQENGYCNFTLGNNGTSPFSSNSGGYQQVSLSPTTAIGGYDWLCGGLSICAKTAGGNVYSVGTAGTAPALNGGGPRAGGTINDGWRYNLLGVAATAGNLMLNTAAGDLNGLQYARADEAAGAVGGWVWQIASGQNPPWATNSTIRGLTITSQGKGGNAVEVASTLNQVVDDVHVLGFAHSVGNLLLGANYNHHVSDLIADFPSRAAVYGYQSNWWIDRLTDVNSGYSAIRMAGGNINLRSAYFGGFAGPVAMKHHGIGNGDTWMIEDVSNDNEGAAGTGVALIDFESSSTVYSQISVMRCALGYIAPTSVFARMRGGSSAAPVVVSIRDNTWTYKNGGPYAFASVDTDAGFQGKVEGNLPKGGWNFSTGTTIPLASFSGTGKAPNVQARVRLPGQTLPVTLPAGAAPGTVEENYTGTLTTGTIVETILGTDAAWHTLRTLP